MPTAVAIDDPTVSDEVFLSQRFDFGLSYRGRRNDASLSLYHETRDGALSVQDETILGAALSVSRALSRKTSASLGADWQRSELDLAREDERWSVSATLSHRVFPDVSAILDVSHTENDSDVGAAGFTENRISARVNVVF